LNRGARKDRVTPELRELVLKRDGMCFLAMLSITHQCRDQWGKRHAPDDLNKLTLDHVHDIAGGVRGKRAPSDERHLVAMCGEGNVHGPSRLCRQLERKYLRGKYDDQGT